MTEEKAQPEQSPDYVRKVSRETGITEQEVRQIISLVGYNHSSIMREARILKRSKK